MCDHIAREARLTCRLVKRHLSLTTKGRRHIHCRRGRSGNEEEKSKYEGKSICVPKTAQDTLPFEEVYEDGIVKVRENVYALVFAYTDIEYNKLTLDSKRRMVDQYHELLNSLPQNVTYQELIVNKPVDPKRYDREMMLKTKDNQEQEELVDSMNDIIAYYVSQSAKSTAEHLTYMALSYELQQQGRFDNFA